VDILTLVFILLLLLLSGMLVGYFVDFRNEVRGRLSALERRVAELGEEEEYDG
jgi:hypothetical protein